MVAGWHRRLQPLCRTLCGNQRGGKACWLPPVDVDTKYNTSRVDRSLESGLMALLSPLYYPI